jgi:hypothetical protein
MTERQTTRKTITSAQLAWMLRRGYAWEDPANASEDCHCLSEVYWTREGGYIWNVDLQKYELVL